MSYDTVRGKHHGGIRNDMIEMKNRREKKIFRNQAEVRANKDLAMMKNMFE